MRLKITSASYHRNGVGGVGFYAILFKDKELKLDMIASLFDDDSGCYCAVYAIEELTKGNVRFADGNSWRGDRYEEALTPLLKEYLEKHGTNRIGPFALPDKD